MSGGLSNGEGIYHANSFEKSPIPEEESYRVDNIYYRLEGEVSNYVREIVGGAIVNSYCSGSTISLENSIGEIIDESTSDEYGKFIIVYETFDNYILMVMNGGTDIMTNTIHNNSFRTYKSVNLSSTETNVSSIHLNHITNVISYLVENTIIQTHLSICLL